MQRLRALQQLRLQLQQPWGSARWMAAQAAPAQQDDMIEVTVNGKAVKVAKGSNVYQACEAGGVDVPRCAPRRRASQLRRQAARRSQYLQQIAGWHIKAAAPQTRPNWARTPAPTSGRRAELQSWPLTARPPSRSRRRFCYHQRLSIAGNCRMCLVEVRAGLARPAPPQRG
jgi:hypothetical protein